MTDKPLDCVGVDHEKQETGKSDFKANGAAPAEEAAGEGYNLNNNIGNVSVLTAEQVLQYLGSALGAIQATFPDFAFSLIGRNVTNPGQDLILTREDPALLLKTVGDGINARKAAMPSKIIL